MSLPEPLFKHEEDLDCHNFWWHLFGRNYSLPKICLAGLKRCYCNSNFDLDFKGRWVSTAHRCFLIRCHVFQQLCSKPPKNLTLFLWRRCDGHVDASWYHCYEHCCPDPNVYNIIRSIHFKILNLPSFFCVQRSSWQHILCFHFQHKLRNTQKNIPLPPGE